MKEWLYCQRMLHVQYISIVLMTFLLLLHRKNICSLGNLAHHHVGANCHFAAEPLWLNVCANGDKADITLVQTRKTHSLYFVSPLIQNGTFQQLASFDMTRHIVEWWPHTSGEWMGPQNFVTQKKTTSCFDMINIMEPL